jgi:hypothetical protein
MKKEKKINGILSLGLLQSASNEACITLIFWRIKET